MIDDKWRGWKVEAYAACTLAGVYAGLSSKVHWVDSILGSTYLAGESFLPPPGS